MLLVSAYNKLPNSSSFSQTHTHTPANHTHTPTKMLQLSWIFATQVSISTFLKIDFCVPQKKESNTGLE